MPSHARRSAVATPVVADAAVAIRGDLSKFSGDLKKAETQTESLGGKLNAALSPKALVGGLAGAFAASKVVSFFGDAIQAAGVFADTVSATGIIFSDEFTPALQEWAEEAHSAFGASTQDALDAANQIAVFGKSAGLAGQELVGFSTEMVQLGGDLASMFGGSTQDAITAVGAALRGESEPIRRYGVLLDDATLRQKAFEMGIISSITKALTPQQRVLAAHAEIMAQTSDAQGNFVLTSKDLMNVQRDVGAQLANLNVRIGQKLLPTFLKLMTVINDLAPALDLIADSVGDVTDAATGTAPLNALDNLAMRLSDSAKSAGTELEKLPSIIKTVMSGDFLGDFLAALNAGEPGVRDAAEYAITQPLTSAVIDARQKARAEARAIPGDISQALIAGLQDIEDGLDAVRDLMENSLSDAAKIARLKGILASSELAAGLLDERADVRGSWMQIRADAIEELQLLESGAYDAAVDTGSTIAEQLRLQESVIRQGMIDALRGARSVLAEDWSMPAVSAPRLLGGRTQSDMPGPPGGGGSNNTVNNNINITAPTVPMAARDIGRELRRTGVFRETP